MELHWLKREGNDGLVLFVLGWSAGHRLVEHISPEGCDVLAVYDYSDGIGDGEALRELVADYAQVYLFAWSFGVWVSEKLFAGVKFSWAVALNGTPHPVNELYGIDPRRMAVTIRGLRVVGMEAFDRKTYGVHFERLEPLLSPRPLERDIAELEFLARAASEDYTPSIEWDKAIVGSEDQIFPPENMVRFWGSRSEILPLPHYPLAGRGLIEKEIGRR